MNSAKTLSSVNYYNYINYWSRFWRLRRCMLLWEQLPVPTWTPYSVKVLPFLIFIGVTFYLFTYFILLFAFCLLTFFCRLYRRQLLYWGPLVHKFLPHVLPALNKVVTYLFTYCCPPRIAPLNVGNIVFNYLINESTVVVVVQRMNEFSFPKLESRQKGVRSVISISNRDDPVYISCLYILCLMS